jgi:hypothetical protein
LRSILQMLLSFKFDYVRLNVGAAPSVPQDWYADNILASYCNIISELDAQILITMDSFYQDLYEETLQQREVALGQAIGDQVQPEQSAE